MSIFQKSVINIHLSQLDTEQVNKAFEKFNENYSFSKIAEIQKMKEEEYQDGFLRDIFVDIFGYTLKPADNYNLAREFKNQTDGKKADGAILKNDKAIAVIELKSTKTKDLTNITQQAFNYKNNQPECKYIITSNFQKLRFYIDYANEFEEFDLFNLPKKDFQLLYLLLHKDSILTDLPLKLKTETKFHEENISDKLYKDYSSFKYKIYNNLVKNNPQFDKLTLFKKSQKFLDRLLFVFFAEDTGLVPPNAISKIIEQWQLFIDNDEYFSLYSRFVKFFIHLDKGHKYKTYDLPAYNGGLFAPDEILDNITIDDEVLKDDALLLSAYDYSTEVDVNILGHIFEHSLNEIEEITAEIEGTATDKSKTKRKKDGVFYTPKYITQYIVENTIGKLCTEKRTELGITEIEFDDSVSNKNGKISAKGKKLFETLQTYKDWMFSLKIVDPACGSGAFLNQALNFLINEHRQIDDIIAELTGEKLRLFDTDKTILEKNLYGVDINDESVEIAKLSLWLRTAQKGRKLSNLNNNIKCGNSLIDNPEVAGEKAFNWQNEFPEIFANGGFDVVIGNPPYGMDTEQQHKEFYKKDFSLLEGRYDLFELFIEKSFGLFNKHGYLSFIIPNTILSNLYSKELRSHIAKNLNIIEITNFGMDVFADPTVHTCIITLSKSTLQENVGIRKQVINQKELELDFDYYLSQGNFLQTNNSTFDIFFNPTEKILIDKIEKGQPLNEICFIRQCIKTGDDKIYVKNSDIVLNEPWKSALRGKGMSRYSITEDNLYLKYGDWLARNWKNKTFYETPKIIVRETGNRITATLDTNNHYLLSSLYSIYPRENNNTGRLKFILSILNSNLATFYIKKIAFELTKGAFTKVRTNQLGRLPIIEDSIFAKNISDIIDQMLFLNKELQEKASRFLNRIKSNFEFEKISTKLEKFYDFDFKTFVAELKKQKIKLSLVQQDEWEEYFNAYKAEINNLQNQISATDKEIDQMVYELYSLTEDEIAIVENV